MPGGPIAPKVRHGNTRGHYRFAAWSKGDQSAPEKLVPLAEVELRRIAQRYLERGWPDAALQTTTLINEVHVRPIHVKHLE